MNLFKNIFSTFSVLSLVVSLTLPVQAKVEGDTIILGAAVSLTGKYTTNGEHTPLEIFCFLAWACISVLVSKLDYFFLLLNGPQAEEKKPLFTLPLNFFKVLLSV